MGLLERRRALMETLGGGEVSGYGDGQVSMFVSGGASKTVYIKTGSTAQDTWVARTTRDQGDVTCLFVPDVWMTGSFYESERFSDTNCPLVVCGPSGSSGGSYNQFIVLSYPTNSLNYGGLAWLRLQYSGSSTVWPAAISTETAQRNMWVSPKLDKAIFFTRTASIVADLKEWVDRTYGECNSVAEFLISRGTYLDATASCLQTPVKYSANGSGIVSLSTTAYTERSKKGMVRFSDDGTFGVVCTSYQWSGSTTSKNCSRFLVTRDGATTWNSLEQLVETSQSGVPTFFSASTFVMSGDGKKSIFYLNNTGSMGFFTSTDYMQSFSWTPQASSNINTYVTGCVVSAAGSETLKTIYLQDERRNIFVSRDSMKSWEKIWTCPTNLTGSDLTVVDRLQCSSTGEYAVAYLVSSSTQVHTICFSDYGREYSERTVGMRYPYQIEMFRSKEKNIYVSEAGYSMSVAQVSTMFYNVLSAVYNTATTKTMSISLDDGITLYSQKVAYTEEDSWTGTIAWTSSLSSLTTEIKFIDDWDRDASEGTLDYSLWMQYAGYLVNSSVTYTGASWDSDKNAALRAIANAFANRLKTLAGTNPIYLAVS